MLERWSLASDEPTTLSNATLLDVEGGWSAVVRIPRTAGDEEFVLERRVGESEAVLERVHPVPGLVGEVEVERRRLRHAGALAREHWQILDPPDRQYPGSRHRNDAAAVLRSDG